MISDLEIAKQIKSTLLNVSDSLNESLELVRARCSQQEYEAYKEAVGKVMTRLLFDVVEPLYERNPSLKPPGWDS